MSERTADLRPRAGRLVYYPDMAVASLPWHYVEPIGESVGEVRVGLDLEADAPR